MKKLMVFLASFLLFSSFGFAYQPIWLASHTATADTTLPLCTQPNLGRHGILHGVCVNGSQPQSGNVTVYNSSSTAVNPVAVILATAAVNMGCLFYDIGMSSGIVYTNSTANNDVTILYTCN